MKYFTVFTRTRKDYYCMETKRYIPLDKPVQVEMLGSDSVMIHDGRIHMGTMIANSAIRKIHLNVVLNKGITGFRLYKGESFCDAKPENLMYEIIYTAPRGADYTDNYLRFK